MKSNSDLQKDVQKAIKREPFMVAAEIGIAAKDGVITLSGTVDSYSKKVNAEKAAKKVKGVKAVELDITINYDDSLKKNDTEIATDILDVWKNNWYLFKDLITAEVVDGWVKLEGEVPSKSYEEEAQNSIEHISGIKGVSNFIKINPKPNDFLKKESIMEVLERNMSIDAKNIIVQLDQKRVMLIGTVCSLYLKDEAGRLAWNAPGVSSVENELAVIQ